MIHGKRTTSPMITVTNGDNTSDSNDNNEYQEYNFNSNESILSAGSESTSNDRLLDKLELSQEDEMILQKAFQEQQTQQQRQQQQQQQSKQQENLVCVPASLFPSLRIKPLPLHELRSNNTHTTSSIENEEVNFNTGNISKRSTDNASPKGSNSIKEDYTEDLSEDSSTVDPYSSLEHLLEKDISFKGKSLAVTVERHYASTSRYSYIAEEAFDSPNDFESRVKQAVDNYCRVVNDGATKYNIHNGTPFQTGNSAKHLVTNETTSSSNVIIPSLDVERFRFRNRGITDEYNGYVPPVMQYQSGTSSNNNNNNYNLTGTAVGPRKHSNNNNLTTTPNIHEQRNFTGGYPSLQPKPPKHQYQYRYPGMQPNTYTHRPHNTTEYPVKMSREQLLSKSNRPDDKLGHTEDSRRQSINSSLTSSRKTTLSSTRTDSPTLSKPFTQSTLETTVTSLSTDASSHQFENSGGKDIEPHSLVVERTPNSLDSTLTSGMSKTNNVGDVILSDTGTTQPTIHQDGSGVTRKTSTRKPCPPTPPYSKQHKKKSSLSSLKNIFRTPISSLSKNSARESSSNNNSSNTNTNGTNEKQFPPLSPSYSPRQNVPKHEESIVTKPINEVVERERRPHFHRYIFPPNPTIYLGGTKPNPTHYNNSTVNPRPVGLSGTAQNNKINNFEMPLNSLLPSRTNGQPRSMSHSDPVGPNQQLPGRAAGEQSHYRSFSDIDANTENGYNNNALPPNSKLYGRKYSVPVATQTPKPKLYLDNQNFIDLARSGNNNSSSGGATILSTAPITNPERFNGNLNQNNTSQLELGVEVENPSTRQDSCNSLINSAINMRNEGRLEASALKLRKACLAGNKTAFLLYGLALRYGCGVHQDRRLSFSYIQRATGITDFEKEVFSLNIDPFELEAASSKSKTRCIPDRIVEPLVPALYECGIACLKGYCADGMVDEDKALKYLEKAASLGHVDSMCLCGVIWSQKTESHERDIARAAAWFRLADKRGATLIGSDWIYKKKYMNDPRVGKSENQQ